MDRIGDALNTAAITGLFFAVLFLMYPQEKEVGYNLEARQQLDALAKTVAYKVDVFNAFDDVTEYLQCNEKGRDCHEY